MSKYKKQQLQVRVVIAIVSIAMATLSFAVAANSARIIPSGKVSIIKDGRVVGEFSKEAPLAEGSLLRCEARCTVKMDDLYMVAEPDTTFSIQPAASHNELAVEQGTAYFSVTETSRPVEFETPPGNASMREISVTDSELKGYVRVSGNETEIGIIEGGTMTVETSSGEMVITPGKQVTIARVNPNPSAAATGGEGGSSLITDVALGVAGAGVIIAGGYALYSIDWHDGGSDGSPSSP
jgi:hypothetical protein